MFSTPETSVHVRDENCEISPLEREEGYGGKDLEKRWVLRREWKTPWDTPTTNLGVESEPGNEGEHSEVADWQGMRRKCAAWWPKFTRRASVELCRGRGRID